MTARQTLRIAEMEIIPVNVDYTHNEKSAIVDRSGITETLIKLTTDEGHVGWGECTRGPDAGGIVAAAMAMKPYVVGRSAWDREAIFEGLWRRGGWHLQPMTANFTLAGIDMALWDLCGIATGQPIVNLIGGRMRSEVTYFHYLNWGHGDDFRTQCREGVANGANEFYLKVGMDPLREEEALREIREAIGPDRLIRIDANQAWSVPEAARLINRWHTLVGLDFVEAPVRIDDHSLMRDLKARIPVPICINEGLWQESDAVRVIEGRLGDYLCFSPYWVGSLSRFMRLAHFAHLKGWLVCKHTHGELGLAAAFGQHAMLAVPNAAPGNQHTAGQMASDVIAETLPIAAGAVWGADLGPGLGVTVDEAKVCKGHEAYLAQGAIDIQSELPGASPRVDQAAE